MVVVVCVDDAGDLPSDNLNHSDVRVHVCHSDVRRLDVLIPDFERDLEVGPAVGSDFHIIPKNEAADNEMDEELMFEGEEVERGRGFWGDKFEMSIEFVAGRDVEGKWSGTPEHVP